MIRLRILTVLATVAVVLAASQWCFAESITLTSSGGGEYDYGLVVGSGKTVVFGDFAAITLSGLSGVIGAGTPSGSPLDSCFAAISFTSSSALYEAPFGCTIKGPTTEGTLVVNSSVLTLGTVDFSMQTSNLGTITGTTQGPVTGVPVPEPAGLVLLGTGLLGLVGLARRKLSRDSV